MKFTNKLGVYTLQGQALENYKKMQCKPAYRLYKTKLAIMNQNNKTEVEPISFRDFCSIFIKKSSQQLKIIFG